jgi:two-component sensor histidine kinase
MNLTELAADVLRTTLSGAGMDTRVAVHVMPSDVLVSPRQVASLAMILSELATNATKHALRADGTVAVTVRAALDGSQLAVEFRDNGPGYAPDVLRGEHGGVGLKLIREMVSGTLRGSVALASEDGAVVRIRIETDEPDRT